MKVFLHTIFIALLLTGCGSSKSYLERGDEDKALSDAIKKLNKNPSDKEALEAIPLLYNSIVKTEEAKIKSYQAGKDLSRWDKIIGSYNQLQEAYNNIIQSTAAFKLITPQNYSSQLLETRQAAAEEYYNLGDEFLAKTGRDNAKKAYSYFKKADKYISGYRDVNAKINAAYEMAIIDVVINPVQDNSYFYSSGWGSSGLNFSNEYFQRTLVRDLAYNNSNNNYAARFYSDWEAQRENIQVDWVVDLRLRNMDIPQPSRYTYRRNRSQQIQTGTDTSGKPTYRTVNATLNITRMSFVARADMEVVIRDVVSQRNISNRNFTQDYRWEEERASYTGDRRALSSADWELINNTNFYTPRREDILEELYRQLYPQVLNNIKYAVNW
jgi:hypothetical protein